MQEKLSQLLNKPIQKIDKLFGDASYRAYYRAFADSGETFVVMALPEGKMSASEEITNLKTQPSEPSFINVQKYLKSAGLPVPKIVLFSPENRWIVLEDLGDVKLWDVVTQASTDEIVSWYKKALDLLIQFQKLKPGNCIAFERSFDAPLLNWEFNHFWEFFIETREIEMKPGDKEIFETETKKITAELCKLPTLLTHRDFQSRNLMIKNDQLYLIDFQDALIGTKIYDLVALLRDSYINLTPHLKTLIHYYCEKSGENFEQTWNAFNLQTLQRKLKDTGRFVFIDRVKKNPSFLPYIPLSLNYIQQAFEELPKYKTLHDMLNHYIPEWRL